ncbi:hypothetical protein T459_27367 [Capsicum annuum]|uniref:AAA+ ATPase At3g28540-like C-terminal domain-containing protein n=1 Tax=Capsicum annuum TaxID=4072 RepID=A0A2G2YDQ9_CAPAN|nr:hypothetical protein T459_27367 [Capsicum annuum]
MDDGRALEMKGSYNFTINHIEKFNPTLSRSGRMGMNIHMTYCISCGIKLLAANYIEIKDLKLFKEIEELIDIINVALEEVVKQMLKDDEVEDSH